jgi:hypothetical protein
LLEVAVGEWSLGPAEDAAHNLPWLLVTHGIILGEKLVHLGEVGLYDVSLLVLPVVVVAASETTATAAASAAVATVVSIPSLIVALLAELLELVAVDGVVRVTTVVGAERAIAFAYVVVSSVVFLLWFRREDGWFFALGVLALTLDGRDGRSQVRVVVGEQATFFSLGALVGQLHESGH